MPERRLTVRTEVGLHARPAALFVREASAHAGDVTVAKGDGAPVSAKSILAVMGLGVRQGDEIVVAADGEQAESVLDALAAIVDGA
ncbi:HPr family phosphocarrier protein [Marinitenerispora sediminis]|uniref:Phosphocarrier protein HPr n=1 Tax=Marinitenerispora sediminis TaxID=1931232 RepID=A0A368T3D6_9ACTN|nr:HPr family phosphocarrier protein [Marinitenerispora sediminis]RCV55714.1 HPr family phosphocarrier protein [Marinitenerispora sediminis]RCV56735.1 HPr family phosphocarrier protein [Marinitenerispora sediminis]RCV56764.1 HPr family phosphocarrier protein [Marinitenerispora sediminis]